SDSPLSHLCGGYDGLPSFCGNRPWRSPGRVDSVRDASCVTRACTTLDSSTTPAGSVSSLTLEGEPAEELSTPPSQRCIVSAIEGRRCRSPVGRSQEHTSELQSLAYLV